MNRKLATMYYKGYSALCLSVQEAEDIPSADLERLRFMRDTIHSQYHRYDPRCELNMGVELKSHNAAQTEG
jgi:hypothetical protein